MEFFGGPADGKRILLVEDAFAVKVSYVTQVGLQEDYFYLPYSDDILMYEEIYSGLMDDEEPNVGVG
jgi:hypothetical protein